MTSRTTSPQAPFPYSQPGGALTRRYNDEKVSERTGEILLKDKDSSFRAFTAFQRIACEL